MHPLDLLLGHRLGSRQATTELQKDGTPSIHIELDVLRLVTELKQHPGQAIILTGTAGDGKTYLAYRVIAALGLDRDSVLQAQRLGGYEQEGIFIDLDLSAGALDEQREERLYSALTRPQRLTLVCANEGKLAELEARLAKRSRFVPDSAMRVNLSRRALVNPEAWAKTLTGVLEGPIWTQGGAIEESSPLAWNRAWLHAPGVAERLRRYLLLPYLLGEPITIRETLSFLAYALGGGLDSARAAGLAPEERLRYLLFNTVFSEPEGYEHGGRARPTEKLLYWIYRFDPADQASPEVDLRLLVKLDEQGVDPPKELVEKWQKDLVVREGEESDVRFRRRLEDYVRSARRWYALASDDGFQAYFPFRHFGSYVATLTSTSEVREERIPELIRGLNVLLSRGQVDDEYKLMVYYQPPAGDQRATIYSSDSAVSCYDFSLEPDLQVGNVSETAGDQYLERLPRRLCLQHSAHPEVRLPISLLLYEVLMSAASPTGGFPATLWTRERDTVARFLGMLNRAVRGAGPVVQYTIRLDSNTDLMVSQVRPRRRLSVS